MQSILAFLLSYLLLTVNSVGNESTSLVNLSVRTTIAEHQTLIVGAVVTGGPKNILARAAGPSLVKFGLLGHPDPRIALYSNGNNPIALNDDWSTTTSSAISAAGAFAFDPGSKDAALVHSVSGAFTLQIKGEGSGAVLVEAYDFSGGTTPRMINVSARNRVGSGSEVLIVGFTIAGTGRKTLLFRGIGPALAGFGVPDPISDPQLRIFDSEGKLVATNDDWDASLSRLMRELGAFDLSSRSNDSAILTSLLPGSYTAQLSGNQPTAGEGLLEIYEVPSAQPRHLGVDSLYGTYTRTPVQNGFHTGSITPLAGAGGATVLQWENSAGRSWPLFPNRYIGELDTNDLNPYFIGSQARSFKIDSGDGKVLGFWFGPDYFQRDPAPTIRSSPMSINLGSGEPLALSVLADGENLRFQWFKDGADLIGETKSTLDRRVSSPNDSGVYHVLVSSPEGAVRSAKATVDVLKNISVSAESLYGTYRTDPVVNEWGTGAISFKEYKGGKVVLEWRNQAGRSWNLYPNLDYGILETDASNPYYNANPPWRTFDLEIFDGEVTGFRFGSGPYYNKDSSPITRRTFTGKAAYLGGDFKNVPEQTFGLSFYRTVWLLTDEYVRDFCFGLISTWILPDNRDFKEPLLPLGLGTSRDRHPEWFSSNYNYYNVFQTIEGGDGYWVGSKFPSASPKHAMNGTPYGFSYLLGAPGWSFVDYGNSALTMEKMGVVQLSNLLLVPPDGLPYDPSALGGVTGNAYMALPLTERKTSSSVPVGDHCWTFFLNTSNFSGPVVFWIPDTWTRLSRAYPTVFSRGLDARSAWLETMAMEFSSLPLVEIKGSDGKSYQRIPRIRFPLNEDRLTYLAQDFSAYSKGALFDPIKFWLGGGSPVPSKFPSDAASVRPIQIVPRPLSLALASNTNVRPDDLSRFFRIRADAGIGSNAIAVEWRGGGELGRYPEYFEVSSNSVRIIDAADLPSATARLRRYKFPASVASREGYTAPASGPESWLNPPPRAGPFTTKLIDGSTVTYFWFRFVDQPAMQGLGWDTEEKERLQKVIERLHEHWRGQTEFMAPPSRGTLSKLDPALLVRPPPGLEYGYVPIVIRQGIK